jgi:hypothetical protein
MNFTVTTMAFRYRCILHANAIVQLLDMVPDPKTSILLLGELADTVSVLCFKTEMLLTPAHEHLYSVGVAVIQRPTLA